MGTFEYSITLIGPLDPEGETLQGLVDTGATFTTVPAPILERLGIQRTRSARLRPANGEMVQWDNGEILAELDGIGATIVCVFGDRSTPTLIGAHTLEAFLMAVDPVQRRLVPTEGLLI